MNQTVEDMVKGMEEVPVEPGLPFPMPVTEEVVHKFIVNLHHVQDASGQSGVVLQFITPAKAYTFRIDSEVSDKLSEALRGSRVVTATPLDLPPGVKL